MLRRFLEFEEGWASADDDLGLRKLVDVRRVGERIGSGVAAHRPVALVVGEDVEDVRAFDRLITHAIREWGVDPDRVYLTGISEGAYGTEILGPYMADRFAAACAMAGGADVGSVIENLRNLPFRTDVGENDTMFNRVKFARKGHARLDKAAKEFGGFEHVLKVHESKGHGIDYRLGSAWLPRFTRNPRPDTVIWTTKPIQKKRRAVFCWLGFSGVDSPDRIRLEATLDRSANRVKVTVGSSGGEGPPEGAKVTVFLDDTLLDLSRPVTVECNGREVFRGLPERRCEHLARSLAHRGDPRMVFPVELSCDL